MRLLPLDSAALCTAMWWLALVLSYPDRASARSVPALGTVCMALFEEYNRSSLESASPTVCGHYFPLYDRVSGRRAPLSPPQ